MEMNDEAGRHCPRCRYDLRGTEEPRCPECGLGFDDKQWASGVLRESLRPRIDTCDVWQPHAILGWGLAWLAASVRRPGMVLKSVDVNGSAARGVLATVVGGLWLYVLATVLLAAAMVVHEGVSPAAGIRAAGLHWAPRLMGVALVAALSVFGFVGLPSVLRVVRPTWRQYVRVAGYWLPLAMAAGILPTGVLLLIGPDLAIGAPYLALATACPGLAAWRGRDTTGRAEAGATRRLVAGWSAVGWLGGATWLAVQALPGTLEPPAWTYF
jgi:hypothetical protein